MFHTTKCRAYSHEKVNTSKGVIRSRDLALATEEEMSAALGKQGVTNISIRKGGKNRNHHLHPDIQPSPYSQGREDRLLFREGRTVPPSPFEVLQMSEIWTPQGSLLRTTHMWQVRWKELGPHELRVLEWNEICKLPSRPSGLLTTLRHI